MFATLQHFAQCVAQRMEPYAAARSLVVNHGINGLNLDSATITESFKAEMEGAEPMVRENGRVLILQSRRAISQWCEWIRGVEQSWSSLTLSDSMPWMINVRGGVRGVEANLLDVWCPMINIRGGLEDGNIVLGRPRQTSLINIRGGVKNLRIVRPADVQVHLHIRGGSVNINIDNQALPAHGSNLIVGNSTAKGRYDVIIGGGADTVNINTFED